MRESHSTGVAPGNWKNLPHEDGNSIRIMDPGADPRYPEGYIRYYNEHGQPLDAIGKPGSQAATIMHWETKLPLDSQASSKTECELQLDLTFLHTHSKTHDSHVR